MVVLAHSLHSIQEMHILTTLFLGILASSGLWGFLGLVWNERQKKKSVERKAILGLLHDKIYYLCSLYIANGEITRDEYDNLMYLYVPYKAMGGNGTGERLMAEVNKLPISKTNIKEERSTYGY